MTRTRYIDYGDARAWGREYVSLEDIANLLDISEYKVRRLVGTGNGIGGVVRRQVVVDVLTAGRRAIDKNPNPRRAITDKMRKVLAERDGVLCRYCGKKTGPRTRHIDHIMPVSLGGPHHVVNLVIACERCNYRKHAKIASECKMKLLPIPGETDGSDVVYAMQRDLSCGVINDALKKLLA